MKYNKEDIFKGFFTVCTIPGMRLTYLTLPQWKRFSFWRLLLFMCLCFSHKYRIQNKLSETVENELEKVFFKKTEYFQSCGFPRPPHRNSIWGKLDRNQINLTKWETVKKSIDYHLSNRLAWSKNQEITLWFNVGIKWFYQMPTANA